MRPTRANPYQKTNEDRVRQANALTKEIGEALSCLTEEAFWWEDGKFAYDPEVTPKGLYLLTQTLNTLKQAIENEVKY
jgi:hypothetical protein